MAEWEADRIREQARAAVAGAQAAEQAARLAREAATRAEEEAHQKIAASQEARQRAEAELAAAREQAQGVAAARERAALREAQAARQASEARVEETLRRLSASEESRKQAEAELAGAREQARRANEEREAAVRSAQESRAEIDAERHKADEIEDGAARNLALGKSCEAAPASPSGSGGSAGPSEPAGLSAPSATEDRSLASGLFAPAAGAAPPPDADRLSGGAAVHKIGPSDLLAIEASHVPEITGETQVADNGQVDLPLIGAVVAAGRSEQELAAELERRLATYVREPSVTVRIAKPASRPVVIEGAVESPGTYPVPEDGERTLQVISEAGGITGATRHARIEVTRAPGANEPGAGRGRGRRERCPERLLRGRDEARQLGTRHDRRVARRRDQRPAGLDHPRAWVGRAGRSLGDDSDIYLAVLLRFPGEAKSCLTPFHITRAAP
jgi:protein involved in polysaccharide export with SLBB domain